MTDADHRTHPAARGPRPDAAVHDVFRSALRGMLLLLAVLTVVGIGIGYAVAGRPGVWGALIGVALAALFSGTTVLSMLRTARSTATTMAAVVMGAWLGKVAVLIVVLAVLRNQHFYSRGVLVAVLFVAVVGSALLDYRAVHRGRVPYVEPADNGAPGA
jgi:cation transport ATPase